MSLGRFASLAALVLGSLLQACTQPGEAGDSTPSVESGCGVNCPSSTGTVQIAPDAGVGATSPLPASGAPARSDAPLGTDPGAAAGGLPCDVKKIVDERCGTCHKDPPAFSAPMALTTYAQFQAAAKSDATKKTFELVKTRVNLHSGVALMPPASSTQLSAAELSTLNAWLDKGAPATTQTCAATSDGGAGQPEAVDTSGLDCYKFLAHAQGEKSTKFKVGVAVDKYYNMAFAAPWQGTIYASLIRPVIDNSKVIHHWLLYQEPGTDGSVEDAIGQHSGGQLISGWAPGGTGVDFRKHGDVAFEMPATSYVVEFHYNSSDGAAVDASGVEVCGKKTPPRDIASMSWLGYDNWVIAGDLDGPRTSWTGTCAPTSQQPIHLLFVTPHMHKTGVRMSSYIEGANGRRVLHDQPFDFAYQVTWEVSETLMPGERITTTCNFSEPKSMGQATTDEMCYLFTYAYPKGALADNGLLGTFQHGDGVCLGQ